MCIGIHFLYVFVGTLSYVYALCLWVHSPMYVCMCIWVHPPVCSCVSVGVSSSVCACVSVGGPSCECAFVSIGASSCVCACVSVGASSCVCECGGQKSTQRTLSPSFSILVFEAGSLTEPIARLGVQ